MRHHIILILIGCLLLVAGASALDGYDYYQTIEYAGCDQDIYQQDIVIHRSTGTAYNETAGGLETWHIYVGDHCQADYDDVRFTNSTGELTYYLWPDYTNSSARFCVRLEGATSAGQMQVWYGNPSAATTSDEDAPYLFFDHFKGTSLDTTKWNKVGSPTVSDSNVTVNSSNEEIKSKQIFGAGTILEGRGSLWNANYHIFGLGQHPYLPIIIYQYGHPAGGNYNARATSSTALGSGWTGVHTWAIHRVTSGSAKFYLDDSLVATVTTSTADMPILLQQHVTATGSSVFDYILVRAYSATPPAALAFSGEQSTAAPPATAFTAAPAAGLAPLTVQFTDLSTGTPTLWAWTFGDGGTSTAQNPAHTYTTAGTHTVTLTATNEYGSTPATKLDYITVYGPITAQFSATPTGGTAPVTVQFTDLSTGGPTAWSWSFGDGGTSTAQNPQHTYTAAGTYSVTLTASHPYDSDTETKTAYITIAVLQPFPGITALPRDLTGTGLYTDINGNNRLDYNDLTVFFQHLAWAKTAQPIACFDFNGNGWLDYNDVITLFSTIMEEHT